MKLVINQNEVGKFNLFGNEKSLAFSLVFKDENNETIRVTKDGLLPPDDYDGDLYAAVFRIRSSEDDNLESHSDYLKELFDEMDWEQLFNEHRSTTGFTTGLNYPEQRVMFANFVDKFYMEIADNHVKDEKARDSKEIDRLKDRIERLESKKYYQPDEEDKPQLLQRIVDDMESEADRYAKWRDDYKEGTEQWQSWDARIKTTRDNLKSLKAVTL